MCLSGGSFLNVLGNSVLKESGLFNDIHVPPCPNDVGLHLVYVSVSSRRMNPLNFLRTLLLGKEYTEEEIETVLKERSQL